MGSGFNEIEEKFLRFKKKTFPRNQRPMLEKTKQNKKQPQQCIAKTITDYNGLLVSLLILNGSKAISKATTTNKRQNPSRKTKTLSNTHNSF